MVCSSFFTIVIQYCSVTLTGGRKWNKRIGEYRQILVQIGFTLNASFLWDMLEKWKEIWVEMKKSGVHLATWVAGTVCLWIGYLVSLIIGYYYAVFHQISGFVHGMGFNNRKIGKHCELVVNFLIDFPSKKIIIHGPPSKKSQALEMLSCKSLKFYTSAFWIMSLAPFFPILILETHCPCNSVSLLHLRLTSWKFSPSFLKTVIGRFRGSLLQYSRYNEVLTLTRRGKVGIKNKSRSLKSIHLLLSPHC